MSNGQIPLHLARVLDRFEEVHPSRDGWDARCPCPGHNAESDHPGDQHPSLHIGLGHDGRILVKCRVGCATDRVLEAVGLEWRDLFVGQTGASAQISAATPKALAPTLDGDVVHGAYSGILSQLALSSDHAADLRRRGLNDAEIVRRQYRTLKNVDRGRVAQAVHAEIGPVVLQVPGFAEGQYGPTLAGKATGLLIPVRDVTGRIQALKIRCSGEPKYVYLAGGDSPSCGSPVHVPLGLLPPCAEVRVTEGELKSDVCMALDSTPTIGIPGVTQWRLAIPVLRAVEAKTVIVAFDAPDLHSKQPVREQAYAFILSLQQHGFNVAMEVWDELPERN